MSYYNTTSQTGQMLMAFTDAAAKQDERVLEMMRTFKRLSPSEVWKLLGEPCPMTSIRRSITGLTRAGLLIKTADKAPGEYGRPEHVWIIAPTQMNKA